MSTAEQELLRLARVKMKDGTALFGEALLLVSREHPDLASKYREEVLKSETVFEPPPEKERFTPSPMAAELTRLARDKAQRDGVTFSEALRSVAREMPLLASDYRAEVAKSEF